MNLPAVIDALLDDGWVCLPQFFSAELTQQLVQHCQQRIAQFRPAGVGAGATRVEQIRGDHILWLQDEAPGTPTAVLLQTLEEVRQLANARGQLGLFELEMHFAAYPPGAGYARHVDQIRDSDTRQLSVVCYLNDHWCADDGGALRLYLDDGSHRDILPQAGTLVLFLSARFPHEVLPARRERLSVTGWFRRR